ERLTAHLLAGLALGFAGIVLLVWPELTAGSNNQRGFLLGVIALQGACAGWALGTSLTKHGNNDAHPLAVSARQMLFGGLILLAIGTAAGEWPHLTFTSRSLAAVAYLTIAGSVVGYSAYVYALRHLPVSFVSLYAYVNPVIAVVLGSLLLSEPFSM